MHKLMYGVVLHLMCVLIGKPCVAGFLFTRVETLVGIGQRVNGVHLRVISRCWCGFHGLTDGSLTVQTFVQDSTIQCAEGDPQGSESRQEGLQRLLSVDLSHRFCNIQLHTITTQYAWDASPMSQIKVWS